jgi:hypothetical protein
VISDLQQRISAALRKGKRQVEETAPAAFRDRRRVPCRAYEVRETVGGVTRRWVQFPSSNAGGGR